ncbi:hypothetical protein [Vibrio alginolyticus]|uniref:hypothetical protein n=1 Tax=Vibrio alginolyticus TaxID=663 RepID=UPI00211A32AC|nr:hypothetical protein [Vibrio alginolyticus]MCQ9090963.1 hypothetical protein [Vibrio alginolyticus]
MKTATVNTDGKAKRKNKGDAAKPQPLILGKSRLGECRLPESVGKGKCSNEQS